MSNRTFAIIGLDGKQLPEAVQLSERLAPGGPVAYYNGDFYRIIFSQSPTPSIDTRYPVTNALS